MIWRKPGTTGRTDALQLDGRSADGQHYHRVWVQLIDHIQPVCWMVRYLDETKPALMHVSKGPGQVHKTLAGALTQVTSLIGSTPQVPADWAQYLEAR